MCGMDSFGWEKAAVVMGVVKENQFWLILEDTQGQQTGQNDCLDKQTQDKL